MDAPEPREPLPPTAGQYLYDRVLPGPGVLLTRILLYLIFLILAAALAWTAIARVDVAITAAGRLVVGDEPVRITAPEEAMVVEVPVAVGAHVEAGAVLLQLDCYQHGSDAARTAAEAAALAEEQVRREDQVQSLRRAADSLRAELEGARQNEAILAAQAKTFRDLAAERVFSPLEAQQKEQELIEARMKLIRLQGELKKTEDQAQQSERDAAAGLARLTALATQQARFRELARRMTITAPVAGTVTQLGVLHPGSVLAPAATAVVLAPDDKPLRALLRIPNASMRRLQPGLPVRLRFAAYPYQDWGHLGGRLLRIEPEADEQGLYRAWVGLDAEELAGPAGRAKLRSGLELESEIIVEQRRVIDLILDPIRKLDRPLTTGE